MQLCNFLEKSLISGILTEQHQKYASVCRNVPFLLIQIIKNASAFLLAVSRMGKTQQCTNYTVQLGNGAKFYTLPSIKLSSIITTLGENILPY